MVRCCLNCLKDFQTEVEGLTTRTRGDRQHTGIGGRDSTYVRISLPLRRIQLCQFARTEVTIHCFPLVF